MGVICSACGQVSQDHEFCDHCNADLAPPAGPKLPSRCPYLPEGQKLSPQQVSDLGRPESFVVLPDGDKYWRIHWLPDDAGDWFRVLQERQRLKSPALPTCRWLEDKYGLWVMAETTGRLFEPWLLAPPEDPIGQLQCMLQSAEAVTATLEELHRLGLVWLNFDPGALEETLNEDGTLGLLQITNLDLQLFPARKFPDRVAVRPNFVAPEVTRGLAGEIGPCTDVFHLAMFCYTWLAGLLPEGLSGKGLASFDYKLPPLRTYKPDLTPGVARVVNRGLAVDWQLRHATPREFYMDLENAIHLAEKRYDAVVSLKWEVGAHTRAGRAKSAALRSNEDRVYVRDYAEPPRMLAAVADGISTCDVGSGALASMLAMSALETHFTPDMNDEVFPGSITAVCQQGAHMLLGWAINNRFADDLRAGKGLMGTTLLAGWFEGRYISIANLGDSRAYLLDDQGIEQLTVDGDLGSGLLAVGTPPEQVCELGNIAKALRECIGGCDVTPEGRLEPMPDCKPTITRWPLLPGDIVVLCTDGLVEEGAFLDPETVEQILRDDGKLPAQELAEILADAADETQRLPSRQEPEGFGDNISCIVIKVFAENEESRADALATMDTKITQPILSEEDSGDKDGPEAEASSP